MQMISAPASAHASPSRMGDIGAKVVEPVHSLLVATQSPVIQHRVGHGRGQAHRPGQVCDDGQLRILRLEYFNSLGAYPGASFGGIKRMQRRVVEQIAHAIRHDVGLTDSAAQRDLRAQTFGLHGHAIGHAEILQTAKLNHSRSQTRHLGSSLVSFGPALAERVHGFGYGHGHHAAGQMKGTRSTDCCRKVLSSRSFGDIVIFAFLLPVERYRRVSAAKELPCPNAGCRRSSQGR